jgi:FAD/FMN-containing dehydrogenase
MSTNARTLPPAAGMRGRLVTPHDDDWDAARQAFNTTLDVRPAAIAFPRDARDVATAVRHARRHGLRVAPQATAHNPGPYGALDDTLIIDVRQIRGVRIDPHALRARVGAGVKWQDVTPRLSDLGLAALHGSSPDVGVAGYSLGGGIGWLARKHGMQTNSVTAIEIVTADGRLRRVDRGHDPDLFWALRGGNGNFGVVTAIEFAVYPLEELYAGNMFFPFARSAEVMHAWARLLPTLPEEMMTWLTLLHFPDLPFVPAEVRGGSFAVVHAAYLGDEADARRLLAPLRELGPAMDTSGMVPPVGLSELAMDPPDPLPFALGHALIDGLPPEAVDRLLAIAGPGSGSGSALTALQLRHMGGALARPPEGAGARATLPGEVCMVCLGVVPDAATGEVVEGLIDRVEAALAPLRAGDYPNFVEVPADASAFFDAETWARLRRVKAAYDPEDVFRGNHRIPPAG